MPIASTDLILYGSLSRPLDDVAASGGAPDQQYRPVFTQLPVNSTLAYVSDAADTRSVSASGRDSTGAVVSETVVLNGVTQVSGAQVFERIMTCTVSASGSQNVTVKGAGQTLGLIPTGERGFFMMFLTSFSDPAIGKTRYEKIFWKNNHASLTLNAGQVTLTADPSTKITIGLAATLNDSVSVANRTTVPGGIVFSGVGVAINLPGAQTLPAASLIGVWVLQTLAINDAPQKNTFTSQLAGTSA